MEQRATHSAVSGWLELIRRLLSEGQAVDVKGNGLSGDQTLEILGCQTILDMKNPIVNVASRKIGKAFLFGEAYWILSGRNDVEYMEPLSKHIKMFSDDGTYFQGAYGPQIIQQMPFILETLGKDKHSRQAVISIWKPSPRPSKDIPCTLNVQWVIRGNLVHCLLNMRSSDVWMGVPYDWFNFSCLTSYLILLLKEKYPYDSLELGFLFFNAGSQHLYFRDQVKAQDLFSGSWESDPDLEWEDISPDRFVSPKHFLQYLEGKKYEYLMAKTNAS
jgi:thymidylate synthase